MDTLPSPTIHRKIKEDGRESNEISSNKCQVPSRMLYITVGQNEDPYTFSPSRVSPLDPNLNSVQYLPSHDDSAVPHETNIIQYSENDEQHFSTSQFSANLPEDLRKSALINSGLVMNTLENAHYASDSGSLVNQESNLNQNHFNGFVGQIPVLGHLENNMSINISNTAFANASNTTSLVDNMQQISLRNESLEYINIDASADSHYMSQLNNGQLIVKPNMNGRYLQQVINSENIVISESNNISSEIEISNTGLLGRISENLLSELQDNDQTNIQTENKDQILNKYVQNNQQFIDSRVFSKSPQNKTFRKYIIPQNSADNKRKNLKSNFCQTLNKKCVNKKMRVNQINSPVDNQLISQNSITLSSDNNSDSLAVSPIELYENSSNYDFVSQSCEDNAALDENGINYTNEDHTGREDYLVVDGGLYSLNGFKTQGFLIEQSSGDLMVCQQLDGQLAIDQSMLDMKLNQMLNANQDINLSLNYDDQIILDHNGRILLKTEIANELEKDAMLTNDVVFNHLNLPEELGQDLIMENDMNDIDMKMNIINDIGGEDIDSKFIIESKNIKTDMDVTRRSKRVIKPLSHKNEVFTITDKTVLSRAWASLPATYLNINKINKEDNMGYGVFARRSIPERTQFGPLEGVKQNSEVFINSNKLQFYIKVDESTTAVMDVSDENTSNWMRFVRPADSRAVQNLVISEDCGKLYFTTIQHIDPKTELRVWYGEEYAQVYGLDLLNLSSDEKQEMKVTDLWPCYECSEKFPTSDELSHHLNEHEELVRLHNATTEMDSKFASLKSKKDRTHIPTKKTVNSKHTNKTIGEKNNCDVCLKEFHRKYSLKRHMLTHKLKSVPNILRTGSKIDLINKQIVQNQTLKDTQLTSNPVNIKQEDVDFVDASQNKENNKSIQQSEKTDDNKNKNECSSCPKVFSLFKDKLEHHMLSHKNDDNKSYSCSQCPKKFTSLAALSSHLKTHPWLKCPMCEKNFTVVGALREHVKVHCVNGIFTCKYCNKKFSQYRLIRKHIRAFHSEKKLPCPQCNKMFPAQDKLKMHLLRHSDHREFLCAHCGKQFKRKDKLTEHMKCAHEKQKNVQNEVAPDKSVEGRFEHGVISVDKCSNSKPKKFMPRVSPNDYHRFIYKCHSCLLGFKRRGMLVNHLAKRHPDVKPETVPELNLPILRTTRNYYCQYCCKVYKSSSKRKAHILKLHPGLSLPLSNRHRGGLPDIPGMPNPTYSQTVGSVTSHPHPCQWCHKQYASKAKLLQHQRKKHSDKILQANGSNDQNTNFLNGNGDNIAIHKDDTLYPKDIQQEHQSSTLENQNSHIQLHFETLDPDDPDCYTDDMCGVKLANNYNYQNFQIIDQEELQHVDASDTPIMSMKLEKTPIVIDVSQLDEYRKSLRTKQEAKVKQPNTNCVLADNLNRPPKKWANNFPFISYPAR